MTKVSFLCLLLLFPFFLIPDSSFASHSMGSDITWTCTGANQYLVTLTFFRDCTGIQPNISQTLYYSSASCGVSANITLNQSIAPIDVTPLCVSQVSLCAGGSIAGIQQYTYQGTLNLPPACGNDWYLNWSTCCRNFAITTLNSPGNQNIFIHANLDNTLTPCNNSPVFNNIPTPIVCLSQPVVYNHGVTDADGDDLVFSLVNCEQFNSTSVSYGSGFSGINPLSTASGVSISSTTGEITFTPNAIQIGVICVRVEEFRSGIKIGETIRDMEFNVINCANSSPVALGGGTFSTCVGANFCTTIMASDADVTDLVFMGWNNGIPGGTFTITGNGTSNPSGLFCWTPGPADAGSHFFTVSVADDACPLTGSNTYTIEIVVNSTPNTVNAGSDQTICVGNSASLNATSSGAISYVWSPSSGLNDPNIPNPVASVSTPAVYTVTAVFPDGCVLSDVMTIDLHPDIDVYISPVSPFICPGSPITLTANSSTATSYAWSTASFTTSVSVSPAITTDYWVQATDANGCFTRDTVTVSVNSPGVGDICNVIYASPSGVGSGTRANPASLSNALSLAACNNTIIKLATGTYVINNPITTVSSNITLEGGFVEVSNWQKTSSTGATTILRSTANVQDASGNSPRLVAFEISNQSNFRFQDLTIQVADAPANGPGVRGISTYGVYLNACSDYSFIRCRIIAGSGGIGDAGQAGDRGLGRNWNGSSTGTFTNYDGGPGGNGHSDDQDSEGGGGNGRQGAGTGAGAGGLGAPTTGACCSSGTAGFSGNAAAVYRSGGGGGGGGRGGQENRNGGPGGNGGANLGGSQTTTGGGGGIQSGCNPSSGTCQSGISGLNGNSGVGVSNGSTGSGGSGGTYSSGFFVPGPQAGTGSDGQGGKGGKGGGGGAGEGGTFCTDGAGAGGGGGGGGGQGGAGGTGGWGGGSAFGIFLNNNGANGVFDDCQVTTGGAGSGGAGGTGGVGGQGGNGGAGGGDGCSCGDFEAGCGGRGGNGGTGGTGGTGGMGANGISTLLILNGGIGPSIQDISFGLSLQPPITMENITCTNTSVPFSSSSFTSWNMGSGATPVSPSGLSVNTVYSSVGRKTIVNGPNNYTGFANIILDDNTQPEMGINIFPILGQYRICAGQSITLTALNGSTNYIYHWDLDGGTVPDTYDGDAFSSLPNLVFNTPGSYTLSLTYETDCCGLSPVDQIQLIVEEVPATAISGSNNFCAGSGPVTLTASGATSYQWSPAIGLNSTSGTVVSANPPSTATYIVIGRNASGLCATTTQFTLSVNDINLNGSSVSASCGANGQATVFTSGGSGAYDYQWDAAAGNQTTSTANSLIPGTYQVTVTDLITGCQRSLGVAVGSSPFNLSVFPQTVSGVLCNGQTNGTASVFISGGVGPSFLYEFQPASFPGSAQVSSSTSLAFSNIPAGTYTVVITDLGNVVCNATTQLTIPEPIALNVDLLSTQCTNNGQASVNANGGTGPYTYSWATTPPQFGNTAINLAGNTYTVYVTDQNSCTETLDVLVPCVLPVEFLFFTAFPAGEDVRLVWETTFEQNNAGFAIERADNGFTDFKEIGWVQANSSPGSGESYDFNDLEVIPGNTYVYRLKQIDLDGNFNYSSLTEVRLPDKGHSHILNVFPIPASGSIFLELELHQDAKIEVEISNTIGQTLKAENFSGKAGIQLFEVSLQVPDGVYFATVRINGESAGSVKVIKASD